MSLIPTIPGKKAGIIVVKLLTVEATIITWNSKSLKTKKMKYIANNRNNQNKQVNSKIKCQYILEPFNNLNDSANELEDLKILV